MEIAFDIDDVIMQSRLLLSDHMKKDYGVDAFNFPKFEIEINGLTKDDVYNYVNQVLYDYHDEIEPCKNIIEKIQELYEFRFYNPIHFITARPEDKFRDITEAWFNRYFGKSIKYEIEFRPFDKKVDLIKERCIDVFVEDRLFNAKSIAPAVSAVFLVNYPWNLNKETPWNIIRVESTVEAIDKFMGAESTNTAKIDF